MNRLLSRIVALLLVPCLLADPALASSVQNPLSPTWERATRQACLAGRVRGQIFNDQALAALAAPFTRPALLGFHHPRLVVWLKILKHFSVSELAESPPHEYPPVEPLRSIDLDQLPASERRDVTGANWAGMRNMGYEIADMLASFLCISQSGRVFPRESIAEIKAHFENRALPEEPASDSQWLDGIKAILDKSVLYTNQNHQHMVSSVPFILPFTNMLTDQVNLNMNSRLLPPAARYIENQMIAWMRQIVGYPPAAHPQSEPGGLSTTGGTEANLIALLIAKQWTLRQGGHAKDLVILASEEMHYSIKKIAGYLGIGSNNVIAVKTDAQRRMDPEDLRLKVAQAKGEGKRVMAIVATAGTTDSGHIDPLEAIADIADENNIWSHLDAAFGGAAVLGHRHPRVKNALISMNRFRSVSIDPHKMLRMPYASGSLSVRDPEDLAAYGLSGGADARRFSFWNFWAAFTWMGLDQVAALIDHNLDMSSYFYQKFFDSDDFETLSGVPELQVFTFRYVTPALKKRLELLMKKENVDIEEIGRINDRLNILNRAIAQALLKNGWPLFSGTATAHSKYAPWMPEGKEVAALRAVVMDSFTSRQSLDHSFSELRRIAEETARAMSKELELGEVEVRTRPIAEEKPAPPMENLPFQNFFGRPDNFAEVLAFARRMVDLVTTPPDAERPPRPDWTPFRQKLGGFELPRQGKSLDEMVELLQAVYWQCRTLSAVTPPFVAVLASAIYAALNQNLIAYVCSPAATAVELWDIDFLAKRLGYSSHSAYVQTTTGRKKTSIGPGGKMTNGLGSALYMVLLVARNFSMQRRLDKRSRDIRVTEMGFEEGRSPQHIDAAKVGIHKVEDLLRQHGGDGESVIITSESQAALVAEAVKKMGWGQERIKIVREIRGASGAGNTDAAALHWVIKKAMEKSKILAINH